MVSLHHSLKNVPANPYSVIEDFFRLSTDVLSFYPQKFIASQYMKPILSAASASLTLLKEEPLTATLRFLRDYLAYGGEDLPTSAFGGGSLQSNSQQLQAAVKQILLAEGEVVTRRVLTGMMYSFPRDCQPDASGVLLALFQVLPLETAQWIGGTIALLPAGSMTPQESQRFLDSINS